MKVDFIANEMVLNTIMQGRIMWVKNDEDIDEQKIISYIKVVPKSPIIMVTFTDGETMEMNEHKCYTFEVNQKLDWKKATKKQIKSSTENV
jgi:hypothetical protein